MHNKHTADATYHHNGTTRAYCLCGAVRENNGAWYFDLANSTAERANRTTPPADITTGH